METLYRKVIIDGKEENLPKEAGTYIAYRKDGYIFQDEYFAGRNSMTRWTDYIDWYLQPIEEQPKTDPLQKEQKEVDSEEIVVNKAVIDSGIKELLKRGCRLGAIKLHYSIYKVGLKEAQTICDKWLNEINTHQ